MDSKAQMFQDIKNEISKMEIERQELSNEKLLWQQEKMKISQIQPIDDEILQLDIGGRQDFSIRKSTLCQVEGSALEAMFSGRHTLKKKNDRYFIDRNPFAFNLMVDFIRNNGELHEQ